MTAVTAGSVAATSVGLKKKAKTRMLLTMPVSRIKILLAGDVRCGQQLAALLQAPLFLAPFTLFQFVDFSQLSATVASALLPDLITHVFLALREILATNSGPSNRTRLLYGRLTGPLGMALPG